MLVALVTALRLFPSADGNQCHVPGSQAPPSSGKLKGERKGGRGKECWQHKEICRETEILFVSLLLQERCCAGHFSLFLLRIRFPVNTALYLHSSTLPFFKEKNKYFDVKIIKFKKKTRQVLVGQ